MKEKGLIVKHKFSPSFVNAIESLYKKYGEEVFSTQGIASSNMDIVKFSKDFFKKSTVPVADISADGNANVNEKNIIQYVYENNKALMKLNSLYLMHKTIQELYDLESANECLEKVISGELFLNDLSGFDRSYCYAFDLDILIREGMNFFKGQFNIRAPKRSSSFIALLIQSTAYISNQIMGASSFPSFFVVLDWFYRKEFGEGYAYFIKNSKDNLVWSEVKEQFQNLIYSLNFPFRGSQSLIYNEEIIINNNRIKIGEYVESFYKEGDLSYSLNRSNGKFEERLVQGVSKHKCKNKLIKYILCNGSDASSTDNHSFFSRKDLDIIEIQKGDANNLLVPFNFYKENEDFYLEIKTNFNRKYKEKKILVDEKWAYLIGQYLGDGVGDGSSIWIGTNGSKANEYLLESFKSIFHCGIINKKTSGNSFICYPGKDVVLEIKKVFGRISHNKKIPRNFYRSRYALYLVAGYIDSDGCISKNRRRINISSVNRGLLEDVQFILLSRGVISRISSHIRTGFGLTNRIYNLCIPTYSALKIKEFLKIKNFDNVVENQNQSYKMIDFEGLYQFIKIKYKLERFGEWFNIKARDRDKNRLCINDVDQIISIIKERLIRYERGEYVCPHELLFNLNQFSNIRKDVSIEERVGLLRDLVEKLSVFLEVVPIKITKVEEIENQEYVYDISVEKNENFLTASNIYAHNSPFTNLSVLDEGFLNSLFMDYKYPDGTEPDFKSIKKLSQIFFEYFSKINGEEGMFTFPIMTLAISLDDRGNFIDEEFVNWVSRANCEKGLGNMFIDKPVSFSSCCRLISNLEKVGDVGYQNSFGVGGVSVGSLRIAGLNLPRLAFYEKTDSKRLDKNLDCLHKILYSHRQLIKRRSDEGFLPLFTSGWMSLRRHYSTIGFVGAYEYIKNKGYDLERGVKRLKLLFSEIEKNIVKWQLDEKEEGNIYNIEQIPAESMAVRLAYLDEILGYNKKYKIYSNQYIPLICNASIYDRFKIQGDLDEHTSGGAILHLNLDDETSLSSNQLRKLIDNARESKTKYFAINYNLSVCSNNHFFIGKKLICPICQVKEITYYTRVVGFITAVKNWNKVRREYEYKKRVFYKNINF